MIHKLVLPINNLLLKHMTERDIQLTNLEKIMNSKLSETNEDKSRRLAQEAGEKLDMARANEVDAPSLRRKAELEYGMALNPSNPEKVLRTYYETEAGVLRDQWITKGETVFGAAASTLTYVESQRTYITKQENENENENNKKDKNNTSEPNTNTLYRKSQLYAKHDKIVIVWTNIMNCIILAYAIVLMYDLRSNLLDPVVGITIALTFASVFILDKMVYALYLLPSYMIQFVGWGADNVHTDAWLYLYVPLVAIFLYIIIYNLIL